MSVPLLPVLKNTDLNVMSHTEVSGRDTSVTLMSICDIRYVTYIVYWCQMSHSGVIRNYRGTCVTCFILMSKVIEGATTLHTGIFAIDKGRSPAVPNNQ